MRARLFANSTTGQLTTTLRGGSFVSPAIPEGADIELRLRLAEQIQDTGVLDKRAIHSISARIGWPDEAPAQGTYQLRIVHGAEDYTTADIAFDATATQVASAINASMAEATTDLKQATVTDYLGGYRIVFADKSVQPTLSCPDNALWPASFVDVDPIEWDGGWAFILDLHQTPVAESATFTNRVPSAPSITSVQTGSTTDGTAINEIQKLFIPPEFAGGTFQIVRGGVKSVPIPVPVANIGVIDAAMRPLADEGGTFAISQVDNGAYIEFRGTMAGAAQDLMTVAVFESPASEAVVHLATATDEMRTLMRGADDSDRIDVPLNLVVEVEREGASGTYDKLIWQQALTFIRPVSDDDHNVAAGLKWNQPRSKTDHLKQSADSLLLGSRAIQKKIGDGSATSFEINHNLAGTAQAFTVVAATDVFTAASHNLVNNDPVRVSTTDTLPAGIVSANTYWVIAATENTFQLSSTPGGSAIDVTTTGTGTHSVILDDGVVEYVGVEVWETAGDQARVSPEDYTVERTSANAITVAGFAAPPTANQYTVIIQVYGRPATYQAHQHPLDEVPEARARIEALEAAVAALQALAPSTLGRVQSLTGTYRRERAIPSFGEAYPLPPRSSLLFVPGQRIIDLSPADLPVRRRAPKLFPAVHDAVADALPTTGAGLSIAPAIPTSDDVGKIFQNQTGGSIFLSVPGGYTLPAQGFAATDGVTWFPMVQYGTGESSYYPALLERELFSETIEETDLVAGRVYEAQFALGLAALVGNTSVYTHVQIQIAQLTADTAPGTPGGNIAEEAYVETPVLDQRVTLTAMPIEDVYGYRVTRATNGDLTAEKLVFGRWTAATAPATARFAVRARLARFDTENSVTDPRGIIAYSGPRFDQGSTSQAGAGVGVSVIR